LEDRYGRQLAAMADARKLTVETARDLVDVGIMTADRARAMRLIDGLMWPDEFEGYLSRKMGRRVILDREYDPKDPRRAQRWGEPPAIAVVRVEGVIIQGRSADSLLGGDITAGSETIGKQLRDAVEDEQVRAVVVRVDSPGGD